MIENDDRIGSYVAGMDRDAFEANGSARDAVERCLERICEAAHRLGDRAPELLPAQPWADIGGVGNLLRHAYEGVTPDILWNDVTQDVPTLAAEARRHLPRRPQLRRGIKLSLRTSYYI